MKNNIVRLSLILALVVVLGLVSALAVSPVAAKTIRIPFDNYNVNCFIVSQTMWISEGGIVHIRDREMEGLVFSDGLYHEGIGHMVANANFDPATGYGSYWGTLEIYPEAYPDGYWAGSFAMQVRVGHASGIARLQGYGELDGLATKSELTPLTPAELAGYASDCNCPDPPGPIPCPVSGAHAVGFVMDPGGE